MSSDPDNIEGERERVKTRCEFESKNRRCEQSCCAFFIHTHTSTTNLSADRARCLSVSCVSTLHSHTIRLLTIFLTLKFPSRTLVVYTNCTNTLNGETISLTHQPTNPVDCVEKCPQNTAIDCAVVISICWRIRK